MPRTGIRNDDEYDYDRVDKRKLRVMNRLRDGVSNWQNEVDRLELLCRLSDLFKEWKLHLPRLEDTFVPRQMDFLIADSIDTLRFENWSSQPGRRFLDFLELTGYRDAPELDELGRPNLRRDTAVFWAVRTENYNMARELFRIYNSYDSNYYDETGLTHFHVACRHGAVRAVQGFLEAGQDPNCPSPIVVNAAPGQRGSSIESPLHEALRAREYKAVRLLLKFSANPNARNSEGLTALHALQSTRESLRADDLELAKSFFVRRNPNKFKRPRERPDVDARDPQNNTPLHSALASCHYELARLLLKHGANPNATNSAGRTALHVVCATHRAESSAIEMAKELLEIGRKKLRTSLDIDAADSQGDAPLHLAIRNGCDRRLIEVLLRNGADPNKPDKHGQRPLHLCCQLDSDEPELVGRLLDAAAAPHDNSQPEVADKAGATALHLVCKFGGRGCYDRAEALFEISRQLKRPMLVDARDHAGRTPLQYAMMNLLLSVVDLLLDHGASLDFPSADHFDEYIREVYNNGEGDQIKLRFATHLVIVVQHLRERPGCELITHAHVMTIMRIYRAHGLFQSQADLDARWRRSSRFENGAKQIELRANLSLWDLVRMDPEEATRQLDYADCIELLRSGKLRKKIDEEFREQCCVHLCEIISRRFFIQASLDSFMQLVHDRVSRETGGMIIQHLMNNDLFNVCLAAASQNEC